jgi:hypothetical protein
LRGLPSAGYKDKNLNDLLFCMGIIIERENLVREEEGKFNFKLKNVLQKKHKLFH